MLMSDGTPFALIAATHHTLDELDPATVAQFDLVIKLSVPDQAMRAQILKICCDELMTHQTSGVKEITGDVGNSFWRNLVLGVITRHFYNTSCSKAQIRKFTASMNEQLNDATIETIAQQTNGCSQHKLITIIRTIGLKAACSAEKCITKEIVHTTVREVTQGINTH